MSTLRTDTLQSTDSLFTIDVEDLVGLQTFSDDLGDSTDVTKGGALVGWKRDTLLSTMDTVAEGLSGNAVNIWEYAHLIVSKPNPTDSTTWDWSPAVQAACNFCNTTFPARPLAVSTLCRLVTPIVINRPIDGDTVRDTFTIFGQDGGGFIVDSAIAMFTSTITPTITGTPPQPSPVSQTIRLLNLTLTSTNAALSAYVLDSNKFLRVWIQGCAISKLKFAATPSFQQSIYFIGNNIRSWAGIFFQATGGSYDIHFAPGNLIEHGGQFIQLLGSTSDKDVTGCSIDGCCIEGLSSVGIQYSHARGVSITNNYFEANFGSDIVANDFPAVTNRGITHSGNMHACSAANKLNPTFYPVVWGNTLGGISHGNTSDHNMNSVRPDTLVTIQDHAVGLVTSDATRSAPGNIMYGSVSPQTNNVPYGGRTWAPGSVVINNAGTLAVTGWITPTGGTPGTWYPFGGVNDASFWRFQDGAGLDYLRVATTAPTASQASLQVRYHNGTAISIGQVTVGAADSGGVGFRVLRVPN